MFLLQQFSILFRDVLRSCAVSDVLLSERIYVCLLVCLFHRRVETLTLPLVSAANVQPGSSENESEGTVCILMLSPPSV